MMCFIWANLGTRSVGLCVSRFGLLRANHYIQPNTSGS